jgi:hypothetical protein
MMYYFLQAATNIMPAQLSEGNLDGISAENKQNEDQV